MKKYLKNIIISILIILMGVSMFFTMNYAKNHTSNNNTTKSSENNNGINNEPNTDNNRPSEMPSMPNNMNTSFYGTNSAILAKDGSTLNLKNIIVKTDATGANGVFSYGGSATTSNINSNVTTVNISDNSAKSIILKLDNI